MNELIQKNFKAILIPSENHELFDHLFKDVLQKKNKSKNEFHEDMMELVKVLGIKKYLSHKYI